MHTTAANRSGRWRRRKHARPVEILAAALDCFAERGFAATRLDDVAARAGVTKGTVYLYFPNKEELFKAVVRTEIVPNLARIEELVARGGEPAPALLERLIMQWAPFLTAPASAIPKLVFAEAGNFPDLARFYLDEVALRGMSLVRRLIETGIARGEFRAVDVGSIVFCAIAPMMFAMLWRNSLGRHGGPALDTTALCRTHLDIVLRGLAPDPGGAATKRARNGGAR